MELASILPEISSPLNISTILVLLVTFLLAHWYLRKPKSFPPFVPGLPLVGHLPVFFQHKDSLHCLLNEWAKKYGDIYAINLHAPVVVVSRHKAVKEILEDDVFSTRYDRALSVAMGKGQEIFMAPYGAPYKERRKFAASAFRRLGMKMGPGSIQDRIQEEAYFLCNKIADNEGEAVDITADLLTSVANVICTMVFCKRFVFSDSKFQNLLTDLMNLGAAIRLAPWALPFVSYIPYVQDQFADVRFYADKVQQFIRDEIEEHRQTFNPEHPRDFIDYCLAELASQNGGGTWLKEDNLVYLLVDLFIGGTDTTLQTLRWALLYMILHPDIQEKVQAEIDSVLGSNKPSLALRQKLPYTVATIMEIQRLGQIAPALPTRTSSESTRFRGFDLPKGTLVIPNLLSLHMDPGFWPEPEKFDPSRFLDKEGKVITKPPSYLPFSMGRRNCMGEQLAKMEIFQFLSSILQQFKLKVPEGAPKPSTDEACTSLAVGPVDFKFCAIPRE